MAQSDTTLAGYADIVAPFAGAAVALFAASVLLYPALGTAFFPRTDGPFVINLKAPSGTRLEVNEELIARVEKIVRDTVVPRDFGIIVSRRSWRKPRPKSRLPGRVMNTSGSGRCWRARWAR